MKPRRNHRPFGPCLYFLLLLHLLLRTSYSIEDDSDYFINNVTISNFQYIAKDNDNLEMLFKDRQFSRYRDLKTYSFREGSKINLKQSKYSSLLEIPIDINTRRDIEDIMVFPREVTSFGPYQHRQRRFLFFGYSDELMKETAKTIAYQHSWLYYEMDFGQILLKFLHIENPEEYALVKFLFKNAAEESKRCRKPFLIVIKDIEALLSLSNNYESLFVIQKIRKWMFQELDEYASAKHLYNSSNDDEPEENLIVVFTTTQPSNLNELLIERFGLHAIFFDFPNLQSQKVLLARQIHEFELSLKAFTTIGDWFETSDEQQEDDKRQYEKDTAASNSTQSNYEENNTAVVNKEEKAVKELVLEPPERKLFRPFKRDPSPSFTKTPELVDSITVYRNNNFVDDNQKGYVNKTIASDEPVPSPQNESSSNSSSTTIDESAPPAVNETENNITNQALPRRFSFLQTQLKAGFRAKEMCSLPNNATLFQFIKKDGIVIVIENRRDHLLREINELLGSDNIILIQGNRTCIMFDGPFERFLLESIVAMRIKPKDNTEDYAYYDKPGYIPEDLKELIKKTIQIDIRKTFRAKKKYKNFPFIITPNQVEENLLITADTLKEAIMTFNPIVTLHKANGILEWALLHNYISEKLEDVSKNITRILLGPDPDTISYAKFVESSIVPVPVRVNADPDPFLTPSLPDVPTEVRLTPIDSSEESRDPMVKLEDFFSKYFSGGNIAGNSERISKVFTKFLNYFVKEEKNDSNIKSNPNLKQDDMEGDASDEAEKTLELQIQEVDRKIDEIENFKKSIKSNKHKSETNESPLKIPENPSSSLIKKVKSTIISLIQDNPKEFGGDQRMQSLEPRGGEEDPEKTDKFYYDLVSSLLKVTRTEKAFQRKKINEQLDKLLQQALESEAKQEIIDDRERNSKASTIAKGFDVQADDLVNKNDIAPSQNAQGPQGDPAANRSPSQGGFAIYNSEKEKNNETSMEIQKNPYLLAEKSKEFLRSESRPESKSKGNGQELLMNNPQVINGNEKFETPIILKTEEANTETSNRLNSENESSTQEAEAGLNNLNRAELLFLPEDYQNPEGGEETNLNEQELNDRNPKENQVPGLYESG